MSSIYPNQEHPFFERNPPNKVAPYSSDFKLIDKKSSKYTLKVQIPLAAIKIFHIFFVGNCTVVRYKTNCANKRLVRLTQINHQLPKKQKLL